MKKGLYIILSLLNYLSVMPGINYQVLYLNAGIITSIIWIILFIIVI